MPTVIRYTLSSARRARAPKQGELSEQSSSLPQTRRRPEGKERTAGACLPAGRDTHRAAAAATARKEEERREWTGLERRGE